MPSYTLMIDCPDEKGLIHLISGLVYEAGANFIENSEFVDKERSYFFMRSEIEGEMDIEPIEKELEKKLPAQANITFHQKRQKEIVVLASKEYHCLSDLISRFHFGDLNANIKAVVSNHENLRELVEKFHIPFFYVPHEGKSRHQHEEEVKEVISTFQPEYLVLAKYMRILTPKFIKAYPFRCINIHHSFLPAFIGANPYRQAYERGVKIIGATAHFVTDNLDEGPIIWQDVVSVDHSMTPKKLARAGREVERNVLARALKLVFEDRVFIDGNKTIVFEG